MHLITSPNLHSGDEILTTRLNFPKTGMIVNTHEMISEQIITINYCVDHPVFAHILLLIIFVIGLISIFSIKTQLIPNLAIPQIHTQFIWFGSSAQQVEKSIITHAEDATQNLDGLEDIISISKTNQGKMILKFDQQHDINKARQETEQALSTTDFPKNMEDYVLNAISPKEQVGRVLIYDYHHYSDLKKIMPDIKQSMNRMGITSTQVTGDPDSELILEVRPSCTSIIQVIPLI